VELKDIKKMLKFYTKKKFNSKYYVESNIKAVCL